MQADPASQSTNIKLSIEFDFNHFKYITKRFSTSMVDNQLTRDEIDAFFNEIYQSCNNFISLRRINCCNRIARLSITLLYILLIVIIIQLSLKNPFILLSICIRYISINHYVLVLRCHMRDCSSKINVIISNHYQEYEAKGLRWKKDSKSIALLELWMDYKIMGKVIFNTEMLENVSLILIDQNEIKQGNRNKYIELIVGDSLIPFTKTSDIMKK